MQEIADAFWFRAPLPIVGGRFRRHIGWFNWFWFLYTGAWHFASRITSLILNLSLDDKDTWRQFFGSVIRLLAAFKQSAKAKSTWEIIGRHFLDRLPVLRLRIQVVPGLGPYFSSLMPFPFRLAYRLRLDKLTGFTYFYRHASSFRLGALLYSRARDKKAGA